MGVWNAEFEAWQKSRLQKQDRMVAAWDAAHAEAKKKGLKGDDFSAFWLKKHDEALK